MRKSGGMKILRRFLRVLVFVISLVVSLLIISVKPIDYSPIDSQEFYFKTFEELNKGPSPTISYGGSVKVGWSKKTLVYPNRLPLAGYGARLGAEYKSIHDSTWVRVMSFDNGRETFLFISVDLLIFPATVRDKLYQQLSKIGIRSNQVYLTATHSHSSSGAWEMGLFGSVMAGRFEEKVVQFIANQTMKGVQEALNNQTRSRLGYGESYVRELVENRLVPLGTGVVDPFLRVLKVERSAEQMGALFTFSAHANCLFHDFKKLSGDYPSYFNRLNCQSNELDMSMFSAGAVASMRPDHPPGTRGLVKMNYVAENLSKRALAFLDSVETDSMIRLGGNETTIFLPQPCLRVSQNWCLRPWVFKWLMGEPKATIKSLLIGKTLYLGLPCDFSGELMGELSNYAVSKGLNLVINSFNGNYIGYVTRDDRYHLNKYETRMMNWFGPGMGGYFSEVIKRTIDSYHKKI